MGLSDFPEIYEAFLYIEKKYEKRRVPKGVSDFFQCLAKPSPVCSYIPPNEECYTLIDRLYERDMTSNSDVLRQVYNRIPLLYGLVSDLQDEIKFPTDIKPLLYHLIALSRNPFTGPTNKLAAVDKSDDIVTFFPILPLLRERGFYEMDTKKEEQVCQKNYTSHKKLKNQQNFLNLKLLFHLDRVNNLE